MIETFLRRLAAIAFGFVVAAGAGAVVLPLAALADPVIREAGLDAAIRGFFRFLDEAGPDGELDFRFLAIGRAFWAMLIAVCAAPLAFAALVGEIAGARGWSWYAGASALLAAASPWIVRGANGSSRPVPPPSPLELRIVALFFLTGALTGFLYWLIAVRGENRPEN